VKRKKMAFGNPCPTLRVLFIASCSFAPMPGHALVDPASLCRDAAAQAASETGVPYDVLITIATVETGRNDQPWPWTVNFAGEGHWYDSADDAARGVDQAVLDGATNIDLGCFQLNYRWHASAFGSVEDMLDPARNATYAAEFLSQHYADTGDWALAAAAYHSGTPEYARAYQGKFEATYARLAAAPNPVETTLEERRNGFPLLVAGTAGLNGSLFPSASGGRPLIGDP
jgi:hypothetical protein